MSRSSWKVPHINAKLILAMQQSVPNKSSKQFFTYDRSSTITPLMINRKLFVHNGKRFIPISITENHVGFKLGQFANTKKRVLPKKKK